LSGGRGKAGVVEIVDNAQDAMKHLKQIAAAEVCGMQARTSYISRFVESDLQIYSAFTYDSRFLGPSLTLSLKGGKNIEAVTCDDKRTVPVDVFRGLDAYEAANSLTALD
jgi:succinyl-CoA synthetase beta subunit